MTIKKTASEKIAGKAKQRSTSVTNGINTADKNQLKRIEQLKITKELEQVPLNDLYMRVNNKWLHKGKTCAFCGTNMNLPKVIEHHRYVCKVLNKKDEEF